MSDVSTWSLYAFMDDDDTDHDEHRVIAEWQAADVLHHCLTRGYDNIYLARIPDKTRFRKTKIPARLLRHILHK